MYAIRSYYGHEEMTQNAKPITASKMAARTAVILFLFVSYNFG